MKIGIIAAMPEELVYLTQNLDKHQEVQVLGNTYYTGTVGNTQVVLSIQDLQVLLQKGLLLVM